MESIVSVATRPVAAAMSAQPRTAVRMLFVDNIRVLLTVLVVLHHLMVTYTGVGSWYYVEAGADLASGAIGAWFLTVNQSFFMGLFFLIAAYFVPGAYQRKGAACFLKDRLIRLGIPLVLYCWVLRPVLIYIDKVTRNGWNISFADFYTREYFSHGEIIGGGPLWFVEALLIFSACYALWRLAVRPRPVQPDISSAFPRNAAITAFALVLGIATFVVRQGWPMDSSIVLLNLQVPFFAQYVALFVVGLVAYQRNWLAVPEAAGRLWLKMAGLLILAFWPMMVGGGALSGDITPFKGGWHWQAMAYALWESLLCMSMSIGLIWAFRRYANATGALAKSLARNAYTVYLVHGPVITVLALAVQGVMLYPLLKWAGLSLLAVPLCFVLSSLLRRLPFAERVL